MSNPIGTGPHGRLGHYYDGVTGNHLPDCPRDHSEPYLERLPTPEEQRKEIQENQRDRYGIIKNIMDKFRRN